MANVGGMQRVALQLHETLQTKAEKDESLNYNSVLLRSAWSTLHGKVPFFLAYAAWQIVRAARSDSVDVVLFSSMVTAALSVPLRGLLHRHGVRTAAIVHGLDVTTPFPPYQWFVPKIFSSLDAVLPVSRATRDACLERQATPDQLRVVPNGIDVQRFHPPTDRASAREELRRGFDRSAPAPPPDALLLCSVGRQVKRKGTAWFVEHVMPRLDKDVHYWIAGDGPQLPAIRAAIDANDLHDQVQVLGRISNENLARLYRGADLFIMPNVPVENDMEGFGIVLLEAGLSSTPAVAARLEGIQDVITEGVNGHLVTPQDPSSFVATIEQYHRTPATLDDAAHRAREHTESTFGWSAVAETYVSTLRALCSDGRLPGVDDAVPSESVHSASSRR